MKICFLWLSLIFLTVNADTFSETILLEPRTSINLTLHNIVSFSFDSVDLYGNEITAYFIPSSIDGEVLQKTSLIDCISVSHCTVIDLRIPAGTYTLFIYNDYYLSQQEIKYTITYWTSKEKTMMITCISLSILVLVIITSILSINHIYIRCSKRSPRIIHSQELEDVRV